MNTCQFHVTGMHCAACVLLIEDELQSLPQVQKVTADLARHQVALHGDFNEMPIDSIITAANQKLQPHGYTVSADKPTAAISWADFKLAAPIAFGFVAVFILLQKLGLVNLITTGEVTYGAAIIIGIVASLSTCMAVVGSLVLSLSASFAKEGDTVKPQLLFHLGRLITFFLLGGVIGMLGATVQLQRNGVFTLNLIIAIVLFILGLNLLDIFPWAKRLQPTLPRFLSRHLLEIKKVNHTLTPFLVGGATFFLPCGFTQSMQLYSLSTGSFLTGSLTMLAFALGTLPILAILSFSSLSIKDKVHSGIFFKTAGLIVIFFALFNLLNSLVVIGLIPPFLNL
ncbi:sulfite exporter TauE/SafE family protein [Candidatus Falkowbacteria bacterium]|nr:sulfite exporter TauE/SafE family protein [Candidatus Falkowbacteria bacterium]